MKKRTFPILLVVLLAVLLADCAPASMKNAAPANVFFAGENGGVKTALDLAAQAGTVKLVTDMAEARRTRWGWMASSRRAQRSAHRPARACC
jgi:hypothetical protein